MKFDCILYNFLPNHLTQYSQIIIIILLPTASGSVLLNDEMHNRGDVAINMDENDRQRYQQQLQLIDEQVSV
jgi:hypothetical protein